MQGKLADMYTTMNACKAYVYAVGAGVRPRRDDAQGRRRRDPVRGGEGDVDGGRGDPGLGGNGYINDYPDRPAVARREALRDRRRHVARSGGC